jgi:Ca2+-binding EF-hand superfamily protein
MALDEKTVPSEEQLRALFDQIDSDGDGFITIIELYRWLEAKGENMGMLKSILDSTDYDFDRQIDFNELRREAAFQRLHPVLAAHLK